MAKALFLTPAQESILRQVIKEFQSRTGDTPASSLTEQSWSEGEDHQAPETYIAKITKDITAIKLGNVVEPGIGEGDVYTVTTHPTDVKKFRLAKIGELKKTQIFNTSESTIVKDSYVVITRTKGGHWVVAVAGGSLSFARIITAPSLGRQAYIGRKIDFTVNTLVAPPWALILGQQSVDDILIFNMLEVSTGVPFLAANDQVTLLRSLGQSNTHPTANKKYDMYLCVEFPRGYV